MLGRGESRKLCLPLISSFPLSWSTDYNMENARPTLETEKRSHPKGIKLPCSTSWPQRKERHGGCSSLSAFLLLAARTGWSSLASLSHSWHSGEKHLPNAADTYRVQGQNLTASPSLSHTPKKGPFSCLHPTQGWVWSLQFPTIPPGHFWQGIILAWLDGVRLTTEPSDHLHCLAGVGGGGEERHLQDLSCLCAWEGSHGGLWTFPLLILSGTPRGILTPAPTTCDFQGWLTACCA